MKDNMIKSLFSHLVAPMAILFLFTGLATYWFSEPGQVSIPMSVSQESWFLPWTWSMDETVAAANSAAANMTGQAMATDLLHQQYTGLILAVVGACGVAAITVAGLKAQVKTAAAPVAVLDRDGETEGNITPQIPPGVMHPGAKSTKTAAS